MVLHEDTLSPSVESLVILGNLSPFGKIACSLDDKTISLSGKAYDLSGRASIEPSGKTCLKSL